MLKRTFEVCSDFFLLTLVMVCAIPSTGGQSTTNLRLIPLGDSITAGHRSTTGNGYRGPLAAAPASQVVTIDLVGTQIEGTMADPDVEGHYGQEINAVAALAIRALTTYESKIVTLDAAINDLGNGDNVTDAPNGLGTLRLHSSIANKFDGGGVSMEQNRRIVEEAFRRWSAAQGSILDLMGDDGTVVIPGTAPHCGARSKQEFVTDIATPFMSRFSKPPVPLPSKILADGDEVIVVAESDGATLDGKAYHNNYVFVLEFREGRLMKATEFLDMVAFNAVWDRVAPKAQTADSKGQTQ